MRETRWCHETSAHEQHDWVDSGVTYHCEGVWSDDNQLDRLEETIPSYERIKGVVTRAQDAFWKIVAEEFPEVKYGDFGPEETFRNDMDSMWAVQLWLRWNHPTHMGHVDGD